MTVLVPQPQAGLAGRACPIDYLTPLRSFRRPSDVFSDCLYVAGGLYGNIFALETIEERARKDTGALVVFNGDCHWFDCDLDLFCQIEARLAPYIALRGNVETEIARDSDIGAGCGCAYPAYVGQDVVDRSNRILIRLAAMLADRHEIKARLRTRATSLIAEIAGTRIGIVHGDASSLAGWSFDMAPLDDPALHSERQHVVAETGLSIFASSHTCTAAMRAYGDENGLVIANNGGAGVPNFAGHRFGLITRIATTPAGDDALYGVKRHGLYIEALPVPYDHTAFLAQFDHLWPPGSEAAIGYRQRLVDGLNHSFATASRGLPKDYVT